MIYQTILILKKGTLLFFLSILAVNVSARQSILVKSIGAFPEENFAYIQVMVLACAYPVVLVIATYLQYAIYCWYNRSQHPFKILVKNFKEDRSEMEMKSMNGNEQAP